MHEEQTTEAAPASEKPQYGRIVRASIRDITSLTSPNDNVLELAFYDVEHEDGSVLEQSDPLEHQLTARRLMQHATVALRF